jgi:hypothetical protein
VAFLLFTVVAVGAAGALETDWKIGLAKVRELGRPGGPNRAVTGPGRPGRIRPPRDSLLTPAQAMSLNTLGCDARDLRLARRAKAALVTAG